MRTLSIFILTTLLLAVPAIASEPNVDIGDMAPANISGNSGYTGPIWDGPKAVLWDNGPFITSTGTGAGGADESLVEPPDNNHGWGCQWLSDIRLTDDFDVPAGETWEITAITLFGYQSMGGPPSTPNPSADTLEQRGLRKTFSRYAGAQAQLTGPKSS